MKDEDYSKIAYLHRILKRMIFWTLIFYALVQYIRGNNQGQSIQAMGCPF